MKAAHLHKYILSICFIVGLNTTLFSQEFNYRGYLKELGGLAVSDDLSSFHYDNIIHHRHETQIMFGEYWNVQLDIRNRFISGFTVSNNPFYATFLGQDAGIVDLSWVYFGSSQSLIHTTIDRLQVNYSEGPWDVTLGRQRLNWGKSVIWNPNDLYNNFAYLDFDYEERPGRDAFALQYSLDFASSLHFAYGFGKDFTEDVFSLMYRSNFKEYDIQYLVGNYKNNWIIGGGWSGYIEDAGFSGEFSYFIEEKTDSNIKSNAFNISVGSNYMLSNGLFISKEFLYNGGYRDLNNPLLQLSQPPSPKNLFSAKTGLFFSTSFAITPLLNLSVSSINALSENLFIFIPQLSISVSENVDLLILSQILKGKILNDFLDTHNYLFMRLKWSY